MDEWISVKEKLPEFDGEILIYGRHGIEMMWFESDRQVLIDDDNYARTIDYATHWMPLPNPPIKERKYYE